MNGIDLVASTLKAEGVTWMACFPANPLIEAVAKIGIRPIVFRQERGGINCVDGFARSTAGKQIGVFASQSGPGLGLGHIHLQASEVYPRDAASLRAQMRQRRESLEASESRD